MATGGPSHRPALVVAATGNESRRSADRPYTIAAAPPAASDGFVAVGAVGAADAGTLAVADFSNAGATLVAPGVDIASAAPGGGVRLMSGTSMAVPHAAGVAALWAERLLTSSSARSTSSSSARASRGTVTRSRATTSAQGSSVRPERTGHARRSGLDVAAMSDDVVVDVRRIFDDLDEVAETRAGGAVRRSAAADGRVRGPGRAASAAACWRTASRASPRCAPAATTTVDEAERWGCGRSSSRRDARRSSCVMATSETRRRCGRT